MNTISNYKLQFNPTSSVSE